MATYANVWLCRLEWVNVGSCMSVQACDVDLCRSVYLCRFM